MQALAFLEGPPAASLRRRGKGGEGSPRDAVVMGRGYAVSNMLCATKKWAVMPCLLDKIVPVAGTRIPTVTGQVCPAKQLRSQKRHVGLQKQRTTPFCDPFVLWQGGVFCPRCSMPVQRAFLACACLLACIGYVHADLLQLAKVRGVQERLYGLLNAWTAAWWQLVATPCPCLLCGLFASRQTPVQLTALG